MEYVALFQLNMVILFVVIWKNVWHIIVYKVKKKKTKGRINDLGSGFGFNVG